MAKNKKELIIPATINEQLNLILLFSSFRKLKNEYSFKERIGRTQGIKFNIKPPRKAKIK